MLFETLKQTYIFLGALYFGLISGIVRDLTLFISKLLKDNKIINFILDIVFSFIISLLFILCINIVNFGEFRFYLLFTYFIGFVIERKSLGFLVDFLFKKIYNFIVKIIYKLLQTKLIKRMFNNDRKKSKNIIKTS